MHFFRLLLVGTISVIVAILAWNSALPVGAMKTLTGLPVGNPRQDAATGGGGGGVGDPEEAIEREDAPFQALSDVPDMFGLVNGKGESFCNAMFLSARAFGKRCAILTTGWDANPIVRSVAARSNGEIFASSKAMSWEYTGDTTERWRFLAAPARGAADIFYVNSVSTNLYANSATSLAVLPDDGTTVDTAAFEWRFVPYRSGPPPGETTSFRYAWTQAAWAEVCAGDVQCSRSYSAATPCMKRVGSGRYEPVTDASKCGVTQRVIESRETLAEADTPAGTANLLRNDPAFNAHAPPYPVFALTKIAPPFDAGQVVTYEFYANGTLHGNTAHNRTTNNINRFRFVLDMARDAQGALLVDIPSAKVRAPEAVVYTPPRVDGLVQVSYDVEGPDTPSGSMIFVFSIQLTALRATPSHLFAASLTNHGGIPIISIGASTDDAPATYRYMWSEWDCDNLCGDEECWEECEPGTCVESHNGAHRAVRGDDHCADQVRAPCNDKNDEVDHPLRGHPAFQGVCPAKPPDVPPANFLSMVTRICPPYAAGEVVAYHIYVEVTDETRRGFHGLVTFAVNTVEYVDFHASSIFPPGPDAILVTHSDGGRVVRTFISGSLPDTIAKRAMVYVGPMRFRIKLNVDSTAFQFTVLEKNLPIICLGEVTDEGKTWDET